MLIGEIILFAGHMIPEGCLPCDGRMLDVQQYQALFSILEYTYGGSGKEFALPDLRGRIPIGRNVSGQALPGRSLHDLGESGGTEVDKSTLTLEAKNLPPHTHKVTGKVDVEIQVTDLDNDSANGGHAYLGRTPDVNNFGSYNLTYRKPGPGVTVDGPLAGVSATSNLTAQGEGKAEPVEFKVPRNPYLTIRYLIVVSGGNGGEYPIRDEEENSKDK